MVRSKGDSKKSTMTQTFTYLCKIDENVPTNTLQEVDITEFTQTVVFRICRTSPLTHGGTHMVTLPPKPLPPSLLHPQIEWEGRRDLTDPHFRRAEDFKAGRKTDVDWSPPWTVDYKVCPCTRESKHTFRSPQHKSGTPLLGLSLLVTRKRCGRR